MLHYAVCDYLSFADICVVGMCLDVPFYRPYHQAMRGVQEVDQEELIRHAVRTDDVRLVQLACHYHNFPTINQMPVATLMAVHKRHQMLQWALVYAPVNFSTVSAIINMGSLRYLRIVMRRVYASMSLIQFAWHIERWITFAKTLREDTLVRYLEDYWTRSGPRFGEDDKRPRPPPGRTGVR